MRLSWVSFVDDNPVICRSIDDLRQYIEDNLGIVPDGNLTSLRHTWLKTNFRKLPPDANPVQVYRYTRAYLLFLISVTIFADASVSLVPTRYLQFFEDIEGASTYAWGAAALAFLYRSLGKACTFKRKHFTGSATLMHCWSYKHIMHMRPIPHGISPNMPRAKRWEPPKKYHGNPHNLMPPIKQEFDNLQPNEVIRNPYLKPDEDISNDRHQFVLVDMGDVEAMMEVLQRQYNDEGVPDEARHDGVGESSRVVEDLAPFT
ncbi:protein MAIN-LIKE 2-like [Amborella trichopoda]|uniref:protein MAIN-LIKE 2-like n=1 Tax=Amborella trichopoda TaxID=13333 RepID=UPI0005D3BC14|nr:protein MAIN-LIKE 2-like [Amborella trichopoda]|eukprot:XP_011623168.1 protein MAIN-LIKE 2-like [Amborella trichopoda]